MISRMKFMNTMIDNLTTEETLLRIDDLIISKQKSYVVFSNVDLIVKQEKDAKLQEIFKQSTLSLIDGKPLIWVSKKYKTPIKEKVSGSDLFPKLCELCAKKGYSMFFLGAAEGVAAKAAENLTLKYPSLNVIGTYSPEYGFEKDETKKQEVVKLVNTFNPDVLVVGLGAPKQEYFIYDYLNELNVKISFALGASLDFEAGNIKRAPKWMQRCGLEWFYRFSKEPKRLFKRYFIDDMKIFKLYKKYKKEGKQ